MATISYTIPTLAASVASLVVGADTQFIPGPSNTDGTALALDRPRAGLWMHYSVDGSNVKINPWRLDNTRHWARGSDTTVDTPGTSSAIIRYGSSLLLAWVNGGSAKLGTYKLTGGSPTNVQAIGTGDLVDMVLDSQNRLVFAVYNGAWKCQVGTRNAAGSSPAWTISGQVDMALTAAKKRGALLTMPGGEILFAFIDNSSVAQLVTNTKLTAAAVGSWT